MLIGTVTQMPPGLVWAAYLAFGLCILYTGVSVVAGYGLWKRKEWGRRVAIGVFAMQAVGLQTSSIVYSLTSAISSSFYIEYLAGNLEFGVSAYLTTGSFQFVIGDLRLPFTIAINLFAVFMIWLLVKARQPLDGEEEGIDALAEESQD